MYEPFNVSILQYSGTPSPVGYLHKEYTTAPTGPAYPSPLLLSSKITKSPRKKYFTDTRWGGGAAGPS